MSFTRFVFNTYNRKVITGIIIFHVLIAYLLHKAYPFTLCFHDTPNYFQSALEHRFIGYRPYGYSVFINFCIAIKQSVYSIVFFQSFLFLLSHIIFIFTIDYIFNFKRRVFFLLFIGLFSLCMQPLLLTNMLISDSIFISLTLIWIATLLHLHNNIKYKTAWLIMAVNLVICYFIIRIRYAGLIYPVIGIAFFIYFIKRDVFKATAFCMLLGIVMLIVYRQGVNENRKLCGVSIFSAFGGWAKLNNATVNIPFAKQDMQVNKLREVHAFFKTFNDSMYTAKKALDGQHIWNRNYPEKIFMNYKLAGNKAYTYLLMYVTLGKLYSDYGDYLIKNNMNVFLKEFYLPNLSTTIYPQFDDADKYLERPVDEPTAKVCQTNFSKFIPANDFYGNYISPWIKIKYFILAILCIIAFIVFFLKKELRFPALMPVFIFSLAFFIINSLFLSYAHPIVFRYISPNEFIFVTVILLFADRLFKLKNE